MRRFLRVMLLHDFKKDTKLVALDLIWASTGFWIRPEKIKFGKAKELDTRPDILDDHDTFVEADVDKTEDIRLGDDEGFIYKRLQLSSIRGFDGLRVYPEPNKPFKTSDLLAEINERLDVQLNEHDLLELEYPADATEITIYADPGSWAWVGSVQIGISDIRTEPLFRTMSINGFYSVGNMDIAHPYKGTSIARLVQLLNDTNNTNYQHLTDFTVSNLSNTASIDYRNSEITIVPTSAEFEEQIVRYRRLSLSVLNEVPNHRIRPVVIPQVPFSIHEILPEINDALGLDLTEEEVVNTEYNTLTGYYQLRIAGPFASLAWTESSYTFAAIHAGVDHRYLENGWPRFLEDGSFRTLEPNTHIIT